MTNYRIESSAGVILGTYEARDEQHALDLLAQDAGYRDHADVVAQGLDDEGALIINEDEE